MFAVTSVAALLLVAARAQDRSCAEFCSTLQSTGRMVTQRPECTCKDDRFKQVRQLSHIPSLRDTAIYYTPSDTYSYPTSSFADSPFYIVNPASRGFAKSKDKRRVKTNDTYNSLKPSRSVRDKNHKSKDFAEIYTESGKVPLYLDIDIQKGYMDERPSAKEGISNFKLLEQELIDCVDLYITIFARKGDVIDKDLEDIWEDEKLKKYQSLTDLDLMIETQNKCHHPANILKNSIEEIITSQPRKAKQKSSQGDSRETNIEEEDKYIKIVSETPTCTDCTTEAKHSTQIEITYDTNIRQSQESTKLHQTGVDQATESIEIFTKFLPSTTEAAYYSTDLGDEFAQTNPTPDLTSNVIFTESSNHKHSTRKTTRSEINTNSATRNPLNKENDKESAAFLNLESTIRRSSEFFQTTEPTSTVHWNNEQLELIDGDSTSWPDVDEHTTKNHLKTQYYKEKVADVDKSVNNTVNWTDTYHNIAGYDSGDVTIIDSNSDTMSSSDIQTTNVPSLIRTTNTKKHSLDTSASESNVKFITQNPRVNNHTDTTDNQNVISTNSGKDITSTTVRYWTTNQPYHTNLISYRKSENIKDESHHGEDIALTQYTDNFDNETDLKDLHLASEHINQITTPTYMNLYENSIVTENVMLNEHKTYNNSDIDISRSLTGDNNTSKSLINDLALVNDTYLTSDYTSSDHVTTENVYQTEFSYDIPSTIFLSKKKGHVYPEKELKIPKITVKELSNDTILSEVNGFESIPNNDFEENVYDPELSQNETASVGSSVAPAGIETTPLDLEQSSTNEIQVNNNTFSEIGKKIIGRLFFLFDEKLVPAKFVQNSDGELNISVDGKGFCDKLINRSENDSAFMVALCNCLKSEKCKEALEKSN